MRTTLKSWVERNDLEVKVQVTFNVWPACRGSRDKDGVPLEPDEDAGCEIIEVLPDVELTAAEQERIERELWEHIAEMHENDIEARADARAERETEGWSPRE